MEDIKKNIQLIIIALGLFAASSCVLAVEPAAIKALKVVRVIPQINVQVGRDNNIYSTSTNERSSTITVINPSVQFIRESGLNIYSLNYAIKHAEYSFDSADNYTDHDLNAQALIDFNIRNRLDLSAGYLKTHEDRGTGLNIGPNATNNASPIKYHVTSLGAKYTYGAAEAKGRIEVFASLKDRQYDNYHTQTAGRERRDLNYGATFFYRVKPKTSLLFEVSQEDIDYDLAAVTLDSIETEVLVGATWEATAKTTGIVKVGYAKKDFDSATRQDDDGINWNVAINWSPRTYSTFGIFANREEQETDGAGNYNRETNWGVKWQHDWTERLTTNLSYSQTDADYIGDINDRSDDYVRYGAGVVYNFRRWFDLGLDYSHIERDSSWAGFDYDKDMVYLTLQLSL